MKTSPRSPRIVPSRRQAISTSQSASRAWFIAVRYSRRSSIQRTGRPTCRAANGIEEILGIELATGAEATPDIVLSETEHLGQRVAIEEWHFGGAEHGHSAPARVPLREDAARLQCGIALH